MTKQEFLEKLRNKLKGLPCEEIEERLGFYAEMIEDRVEEGFSEEDAVEQIGSVDEIATQIISETSLAKIVKERVRPKNKISLWRIVMWLVFSPVWLPLVIVGTALFIVCYVLIWVLIIVLWTVFITFAASFVGGVACAIAQIAEGNIIPGIALIGAAMVLAGLAIAMLYICRLASKGGAKLTKRIMLSVKNRFIGRRKDDD